MTVRVAIGEDDFLVRQGVVTLLGTQPDLEVVAACGDLAALLGAIDATEPDVVLTDIRMPPSGTDEGIRLAAHVAARWPDVGVVLLSQYDDPEYVLALLEGGSEGRGYLLKETISDVAALSDAVREVARGGSVIDPKVVESLVAARTRGASPLTELTPRERDVLRAMAEGLNNAAVAARLGVGVRAVEKHINVIFSKLGLSEEPHVHKRVKAVVAFLGELG